MKLKDNLDYVYLKSRMQSKYDNNDYLPNAIKDSIKGLLIICEDLEKEIEELKDINASLLWQRNNIDIPKLEDFNKNYINKDKIKEKIRAFKSVKQEIFRLEHKLGIPSITYDILRNDYCEKMLEDLLKE